MEKNLKLLGKKPEEAMEKSVISQIIIPKSSLPSIKFYTEGVKNLIENFKKKWHQL